MKNEKQIPKVQILMTIKYDHKISVKQNPANSPKKNSKTT